MGFLHVLISKIFGAKHPNLDHLDCLEASDEKLRFQDISGLSHDPGLSTIINHY
jgi:hypothetical protein